jgi:hypothetical protein
MELFFPLICYFIMVGMVKVLFGNMRKIINDHFPFFMFMLLQLPYPLRILISDYALYDRVIFNELSVPEFYFYISIYYLIFSFLIFCYYFFSKGMINSGKKITQSANSFFLNTKAGYLNNNNSYLSFIIISTMIIALIFRIYYVGDRGALLYQGDFDSVEESRSGGGTTVFGFLMGYSWLVYLFLVQKSKNYKVIVMVFLIYAACVLVSGSKAGFFMNLLYLYFFMILNKKFEYSPRHFFYAIPIFLVSITIGVISRVYLEIGEVTSLGILQSLYKAFNRWHGLEMATLLMNNPEIYHNLFLDFFGYSFTSMVPGFLWEGKPLNPSFILNDLINGGSVKAVSTSWLGGCLLAFGDMGYFIGPIFIAWTFAVLAKKINKYKVNQSLNFPHIFYISIAWVSIIAEGGFYKSGYFIMSIVFFYIFFCLSYFFYKGRLVLSYGKF